jgi:hypothetical protein
MGGYDESVSHGNNVGDVERRSFVHNRNECSVTADIISVGLLHI